jgi:hypothetical protein
MANAAEFIRMFSFVSAQRWLLLYPHEGRKGEKMERGNVRHRDLI